MPADSSTSAVSDRTSVDARVDAEMTRLLYESAGFGLFSNAVLSIVLVAGVWTYFPPALTLGWLSGVLAITAARVSLNAAFVANDRSDADLPRWRRAFLAGLTLAGLAWGIAGWVFLDTLDLLPRSLVILIIAGMNAGAARALAPVRACYVTYLLLTLTPVVARFLEFDEPGSWTLATSAITYALFLLNMARLHRESLRRLNQLNFENQALVAGLSLAKDRAEAASRAKTDFLVTMSQELRTPLTGIVGLLQAPAGSGPRSGQPGPLDLARSSAQSLIRLLNDIFELARLETGTVRLEEKPFSPAAVLNDVAALLAAPAEAKRIQLFATVRPGVPGRVRGDEVKLRQVLFQLVENAVKFTDHGRIELELALGPSPGSSLARLRYRVSDTGIGLEPTTRAALFERFAAGETALPRPFGGAGLGLPIAQHLVRLMGGQLDATSQVGVGSTFTVEVVLPLAGGPAA